MDIVNKYLENDPNNALFLGLRGWGLYKQGKYDEALHYLKMSDQKSLYLDFEVYQHLQEVEKSVSIQ
jgi:tetratricopeptide (TPR) repeat protein